jgi:SAM-dependent methyltransferase
MTLLTASKIEYILLRLLRRYLFPAGFLERHGRYIPYYRVNCNRFDPASIISRYRDIADRHGIALAGSRVLEIGPGATNSTAYALAAYGCAEVYALEPFTRLDDRANQRLLETIANMYGANPRTIASRVNRITRMSDIPGPEINLVLSNSVLEHVRGPNVLFKEIGSVLLPNAAMIHCIDYRDHFFKYPFHRLLFSQQTWARWLDPGDLPGWSLKDHKALLEKQGWTVVLEDIARDTITFGKIKGAIAADYDRHDPFLDVTTCVMVVK